MSILEQEIVKDYDRLASEREAIEKKIELLMNQLIDEYNKLTPIDEAQNGHILATSLKYSHSWVTRELCDTYNAQKDHDEAISIYANAFIHGKLID